MPLQIQVNGSPAFGGFKQNIPCTAPSPFVSRKFMAESSEVPKEQRSSLVLPPLPRSTTADPSLLDISSFTHTPSYCEENVYLLCKKLSVLGLADPSALDLFVVFISNEEKKIPMWCQKASKRFDGLVIWDYHVICIQSQRNREGSLCHLVWDLDSCLPFPFPLNQYLSEAFRPLLSFNFTFSRLFRVVHAPIFISCFASDRSHMRDPLGNWLSLPPIYEPIVAKDGAVNNLEKYVQMRAADTTENLETLVDGVFSNKFGVLLSESLLESFFSQIHLFTMTTKSKKRTNGSS